VGHSPLADPHLALRSLFDRPAPPLRGQALALDPFVALLQDVAPVRLLGSFLTSIGLLRIDEAHTGQSLPPLPLINRLFARSLRKAGVGGSSANGSLGSVGCFC
jgi:hypothetical protein